ncbi:MAG: autotransporter domain-containing protein [Deltaproteobacteria bacterium]|nr:autotransporter domain-containing protein [Deltaproteobacteria bacterium]
MHEGTWLRRIGFRGCFVASLMTAVAVFPAAALAEEFRVDTLVDGVGADVDGMRTFRWALDQANGNDDTTRTPDTIIFDDLGTTLAELEALSIGDRVIQIELTLSPADLFLTITSELTIIAPTADEGTQFFMDIVRPAGENGSVFLAHESLTLVNTELRAEALIINGPISGSTDTIDLVYDIGDFVHDITGERKEFYFLRPPFSPGRLVKTGLGELALLSTVADYTGGTLLVDGVLRTDTRSLKGDVQICAEEGTGGFNSDQCADALLIFEMPSVVIDTENTDRTDPPVNGTYAGKISDGIVGGETGRVVKTGIGTLTLTGNNTYQGGTFIMQGEVVGDTKAIQGDVFICPGVMNITKPNSGDLIRCDAATQSQLTFDISDNSVYAGTLKGQGIVEKDGNAHLTLSASHPEFSGNIEIDDGRLVIDGQLGTVGSNATEVDVAVNNGGTLAGSGTINGDLAVNNGGTLDLTDQILNGATATLDDGSTIAIEVGTAPLPGHLDLSGTLTLGAGKVEVAFDPDFAVGLSPGDSRSFTVAESDNAITDELTGGKNDNGIGFTTAIFNLALSYDDGNCLGANNVCLNVFFDPTLEDDAVTDNQKEVARVLDQAFICSQDPTAPECMIDQSTANDFIGLFGNFAVPSQEIPDILDELAGEEYSAFADVRSAGASRFNRSISRRFDLELRDNSEQSKGEDGGDGGNDKGDGEGDDEGGEADPELPDVSASGARFEAIGAGARNYRDTRSRMTWRRRAPKEAMPMSRHAGKGGWTGWMDLHGVIGELGGSKNAEDIDYYIYGPLFGIDYGVSESVTVGAAMGYTRNELKTPGTSAKGEGNTYQAGVYVGAVFEDLHVTGAARYAYSDLDSRRHIRFGSLDRTATADFDAHDTSVFVEAAYRVPMPGNLMVEPLVSVGYNHLYQKGFDESGADSLNLEIDKQEYDLMQTSVGVRLGMFGRDADDRYLLPQLRLAYEREWLDKDRSVSANLPAAGENGEFNLDGLALPRDRAVIGVSSEVGVSDRINLFVDYDLRASKDLLEHSLAFGFRAIW